MRSMRVQTSTFVLVVAGIAATLVGRLPVLRALRRIEVVRIVREGPL